jgi:hypothetical protein
VVSNIRLTFVFCSQDHNNATMKEVIEVILLVTQLVLALRQLLTRRPDREEIDPPE